MQVYEQHGFSVFHMDTVTSTMDAVRNQIQGNIKALPCVVLADKQTQGRGRRANMWASMQGNFFATFAVLLEEPIQKMAQLSFLFPLVVREALLHFAPNLDLSYKWPNDLLLNGKKIAGVLLEIDHSGTFSYLKIGVGVNLLNKPDTVTRYEATSLFHETGVSILTTKMLSQILKVFSMYKKLWQVEGFLLIRRLWLEHAAFLNQSIQVNLPNETISGIFKDIDEIGALCLLRDGKVQKITAGDVYAFEGGVNNAISN